MTICSYCNTPGHNKRTCLVHQISLCLIDDPIVTKPKRKYVCTQCNGVGHNSRTCGLNQQPMVETGTMPGFTWNWWENKPQSEPTCPVIKNTRHCTHCGDIGHNVRTCKFRGMSISPLKPSEADTAQKPSLEEIASNIRQYLSFQSSTPPTAAKVTKPVTESTIKYIRVTPSLRRKARIPETPNRGVQVTQVVDYNIYDEPWVWAPIRPVKRHLKLSSSPIVLP